MKVNILFVSLFSFPIAVGSLFSQEIDTDDDFEQIEGPRFSRSSEGAGIAVGFGVTGIKPKSLSSSLDGDMVLTSIDAFAINNGFLFGGSWVDATIYDLPNDIDEFNFDYSGLLVGYDHSLFYGLMTVRASMLLGGLDVKLTRSRADISDDPFLNPEGLEVLQRIWDAGSFFVRPGIGIGWSPSDLMQFRVDAAFLYPTAKEGFEDFREPTFTLQIVFGPSR